MHTLQISLSAHFLFSQMLHFQIHNKIWTLFFKAHVDIIFLKLLYVSGDSPLLLSLLEHSQKGVTMKPAAQDIQFIKEIYFL